MDKRERRIAALGLTINYIPTADENHSMSILLDMLEELRNEEEPAGGKVKITNGIRRL